MNGGKNREPQSFGYTIVEVMIFLAISGVMFLMAALFISGKQASAQFTTGVNDFSSRIQATIQEVSDGQYPSPGGFACSVSGGVVTLDNGSNDQGTNGDCTYLGKVLHFSILGDANKYEVFSVAGRRSDTSGNPILKLFGSGADTANVKAINAPVDLTDHQLIPQNLLLGTSAGAKSINVVDATTGNIIKNIYAIGFLTMPPSSGGASPSLQSGAQSVGLYYIATISPGMDEPTAGNNVTSTNLLPASAAIVCLTDGSRNAAIAIGSNNNQLATEVNRTGAVTCTDS